MQLAAEWKKQLPSLRNTLFEVWEPIGWEKWTHMAYINVYYHSVDGNSKLSTENLTSKTTYMYLRASTCVSLVTTRSRSSWSGRLWSCEATGFNDATALCLGRQSVGILQLVERVVATAPLAVLLGRQRKHVPLHRQDVTYVDLPRRLLRPRRASLVVTGRRGRRLAGSCVAVVDRVRLDVAVDVGQEQPLPGSGAQRGDDERLERLATSTGLVRRLTAAVDGHIATA